MDGATLMQDLLTTLWLYILGLPISGCAAYLFAERKLRAEHNRMIAEHNRLIDDEWNRMIGT